MGKTLVIAEKPSVARDIARALGCGGKAEGYIQSDNYIVSWAIGHLLTLYEPEDYDPELKKWRAERLPILPDTIKIKPLPKTKAQLGVLKKLMNSPDVERIICATDSGREGELIFRYIYQYAGCKKPFDRLWISSMTDAAIKEGFSRLLPGTDYDALFRSARCRSEADWLVGINASRAYTLRYNALLSIGRVQTPTLAIISQRQKEIDAFVPQDYFEIAARLYAKAVEFKAKWFNPADNETKITDKAKAEAILNAALNPPAPAKVLTAEAEEKRQPPPLLYDLTELQREANRKFGYSAQKTLETAQSLYEKRKLITYPRTDSRYLSADIIPKLSGTLTKLSAVYGAFTERLLALDKLPVNKRIVDDSKVTDHHAIIPTDTGKLDISGLSPGEAAVFGLVAKRFIAVFYPYYVYNALSIVSAVNGQRFISKGSAVVDWGWMALYKDDRDTKKDEDENPVLPALSPGDEAEVREIKLEAKKTKPPPHYTEASLLSAMEHAGRFVDDEELKERLKDSGLGTPATRASIIERLLQVDYIKRSGKALIPTEKGMKLIEAVPPELKSPETTGKWEKGLSSIAASTMDPQRFMASIERYVRYIVEQSQAQAKTGAPEITFPEDRKRGRAGKGKAKSGVGVCPLCGAGVFENRKSFFCASWKNGCKFQIWKNDPALSGAELTPELAATLLKKEPVPKAGGSGFIRMDDGGKLTVT
ncbi:MAG: DNA topoisomerase III [Clostridiales bacterium]|jgi:DNA topoisomerase-3|nr:DNA topoisomerase III [Clostridiales bacterium]